MYHIIVSIYILIVAEISQHVVDKRKMYAHATEKECTQHAVAQWSPRGGSQS